MTTNAAATRDQSEVLSKVALGLAILSIIAFFGLGILVGDWWFVVAFVIALAAVVIGWLARNRPQNANRRMASLAIVLGAIPVAWFVVYMIVVEIF